MQSDDSGMSNPEHVPPVTLTAAEKRPILDAVKRTGLGPVARILGMKRETLASVLVDAAHEGSVVLTRSRLPFWACPVKR